MKVYSKITAIVAFIFALGLGAAAGLACYYYAWLHPTWNTLEKGFVIFGFSFAGLIVLLYSVAVGCLAITGNDLGDDSTEVKLGIAAIFLTGVIPGIMFLVEIGMAKHNRSHRRSVSTDGGYARPKRKAPDYDIDDDPNVVRKTGSSGKKPSGSSDGTRKRANFRNEEDGKTTTTKASGKKKLEYKGSTKTTKTGKRKLVY